MCDSCSSQCIVSSLHLTVTSAADWLVRLLKQFIDYHLMDVVVDNNLNGFLIIDTVLYFQKKSLQEIQEHKPFFGFGCNIFKFLL